MAGRGEAVGRGESIGEAISADAVDAGLSVLVLAADGGLVLVLAQRDTADDGLGSSGSGEVVHVDADSLMLMPMVLAGSTCATNK